MLIGFKAMSSYLKEHAGISMHQDTLRKATRDGRNPLPVVWDGGFATIEPLKLMQWRESKKGLTRPHRK